MSTKVHATIDALGNPTDLHLTLGQACDQGTDQLLLTITADIIITGKGYDADSRVI